MPLPGPHAASTAAAASRRPPAAGPDDGASFGLHAWASQPLQGVGFDAVLRPAGSVRPAVIRARPIAASDAAAVPASDVVVFAAPPPRADAPVDRASPAQPQPAPSPSPIALARDRRFVDEIVAALESRILSELDRRGGRSPLRAGR